MWKEHAIETARVLSQIDPDFIRVRTFKALRVMPIYRKIEAGELELMNDDEIVAEERLLIENLNGITSHFASDHILNLLEELDGKFPEAKEKMLAVIDRYLALSREDRNNFRLGRRAGYYRALDDMENPELRARVDLILQRIEQENPGELRFRHLRANGILPLESGSGSDRYRGRNMQIAINDPDTDSDPTPSFSYFCVSSINKPFVERGWIKTTLLSPICAASSLAN